ncbi:hypothetical protein FACS1894187_21440 [Synergistales bacterium]|nr:hypothetical protein FACS1894187_21440 [Synergistales bacterium]
MRKTWKFGARFLLVLCFVSLLSVLGYWVGIRVNVTASLPQILWIIHEINENDVIKRGEYVTVLRQTINTEKFDEKARSVYFGGRIPMLKQVFALPGDTVEEDVDVIILSTDKNGSSLPVYTLPAKLGNDEYWLISDKKTGFDSRYFGPVKREAIIAKAVPIF